MFHSLFLSQSAVDKGLSTTLRNYGLILLHRVELKGFSMMDYFGRLEEGGKALAAAVMGGELVAGNAETVVDLSGKFEDIPKTWHGIFEGVNTGKLVIKLSD